MAVEIRKNSAAKQTHTTSGGDKAVIDEHGYRVKITIDVDYNRLTAKQIPHRHKAIHELVDGALEIAADLRGSGAALYEISDLDVPLPLDIDMDTNHA